MKSTVPAETCTGCAACAACCPQDAISMVEDREGFLYPRIDAVKCNECNLCMGICPVQKITTQKIKGAPTIYAGWTEDSELLRQSSSGGVFSELALNVLKKGGVVFGAAYDETMTVRHLGVEKLDNLRALRGSKYVQSDVGKTYRQAEKYLKAGRPVLYSGTSCQIAGLYATIGNKHVGLLTTDLICHGVPSPKVFRMAIESIEKRNKSKVVGFHFRDKSFGWLYPTVRITMDNGKYISESHVDNHFNIGFQKNIYLRPSCHQCPFKQGKPVADITLGDFWQLLKYQPSLLNRKGTSVVVVNTERGHKAIHDCDGRLTYTECPFAFIEKESYIRKSSFPSSIRDDFFSDLDQLPFEKLASKHIKSRMAMVRWIAHIRRLVCKWI